MDKLDELLSIFEEVEFDSEEDVYITKSLTVLSKLDSDERDAIAETIVALSKLYNTSQKVKKSIEDLWPSLSLALSESQMRAGLSYDDLDDEED